MATYYSRETTGAQDGTVHPPKKLDFRVMGAKVRRIRATFDMAAQVAGSFLQIGVRPQGSAFAGLRLTTDTSLGAATVSAGSVASPARDKAAAVFTAVDTPTDFAKTASLAADPLTADEIVGLTTAAAALPASGILVAEYYYTTAN
jgi:hypothetical protein